MPHPAKKLAMPARVAFVNDRVWLEVLRDGNIRIVAGGSFRVSEPVDLHALTAALTRLTEDGEGDASPG